MAFFFIISNFKCYTAPSWQKWQKKLAFNRFSLLWLGSGMVVCICSICSSLGPDRLCNYSNVSIFFAWSTTSRPEYLLFNTRYFSSAQLRRHRNFARRAFKSGLIESKFIFIFHIWEILRLWGFGVNSKTIHHLQS